MKTAGIVAEYNPFHNGHLYHIEKTKKITGANFIVAVMSGNFVQRGEPAILDKWTRAELALKNGCDMVLELPAVYSSSSAEFFSKASVKILNDTNIVDFLCFGSESGDINELNKIANILYEEPLLYKAFLKKELDRGIVFPKARLNALKNFSSINQETLENPNNILGIEYLKALKALNSSIIPETVTRNSIQYHSNEKANNIASALGIRNAVKNNDFEFIKETLPKNSYDTLTKAVNENISPIEIGSFSFALNYILRTMPLEELGEILDITEGLENRIYKAIKHNYDINEIINYTKTKRYTYTKIQRAILHIILNIKTKELEKYNQNGYAQYIRVLGFRKKSEALLKNLVEKSSVPVITNLNKDFKKLKPLAQKMLETEIKATDIYYLGTKNVNFKPLKKELTSPIVII